VERSKAAQAPQRHQKNATFMTSFSRHPGHPPVPAAHGQAPAGAAHEQHRHCTAVHPGATAAPRPRARAHRIHLTALRRTLPWKRGEPHRSLATLRNRQLPSPAMTSISRRSLASRCRSRASCRGRAAVCGRRALLRCCRAAWDVHYCTCLHVHWPASLRHRFGAAGRVMSWCPHLRQSLAATCMHAGSLLSLPQRQDERPL